MAKFLMLGKYSAQAVKGIAAARTKKAAEMVEKAGGKVVGMYALLGEYDLALIIDLPGIQDAVKMSVALTGQTDIGFTTLPAMPVEEFDRIMGS
jgi:uncharacterized protein with GYD domain